MNYVASCSFGKDSLAAIVAAERAGVHIDEAVYCRIMFDRETSAELPEHEEFIHCTAIPLLKSRYGIKTTIVQEKRTYCECFYTVKSRKCSKNKGKIWGFPSLWAPWCNGSLKIPPIEHWRKTAGEYVSIVGIAADEKKRVKKKTVDGKYLPLVEQEITEAAAFDICKREGLLSPAYKKGRTRLGCWFCHNQRINEFRRLRAEHPELWEKLLALDPASPRKFTKPATVAELDARFAAEDAQISLFD